MPSAIPRFFKEVPQAGKPLSMRGLAAGLAAMARALEKMEVHNGKVDWANGVPRIIIERLPTGNAERDYAGELWYNGIHYYDNTAFSPPNTSGVAISGTYAGAIWIRIELNTQTASYQIAGPSGANWGDNVAWVEISTISALGSH